MKLNQRDKKALMIGAGGAVLIVVLYFGMDFISRWQNVRTSLSRLESQIEAVESYDIKSKALASVVPVFEMPQHYEKQKFLFREKLNEQLKKAGIAVEPLQVMPLSKPTHGGYKLLRIKCNGSGKIGQVFDLLADLKSNPHLVGVDEFKMTCDQKNRQNVKVSLVVSTFVK